MTTHNLAVVLTGNATNLRGVLTAAGRDVKAFGTEVKTAGASASTSSRLMQQGLKVGILAVGAAAAYSVNQAIKFETELRNIQSLTKQSEASLGDLGSTLIGLSTRLPQDATTLAQGFYDIASSGFEGADAMMVLEASAMAASAGLTTTEVSAKAIAATLNAYGQDASHAADVSDVLFKTVDLGVISFEELAGGIGDVVGTAAAATVEIDEIGAAMAAMTLSGIGAAEASTSLNRLVASLIKPSDALAEAFKSIGYESGAQALQVDSLSVVMEKLRVASGGNIEVLLEWFTEIRAARGALALMAADGENYAGVVAQIEDKEARAGATRAALNEQMKSFSNQWKIFINQINAGATALGIKLLPAMKGALAGFQDLGSAGVEIVLEGMERLQPLAEALADIWSDLQDIGGDLLRTLGPIGRVLGGLVGFGVIAALNTLGSVLSSVTGFLSENEGITRILAALLIGRFLTSIVTTGNALKIVNGGLRVMGGLFGPIVQGFSDLRYAYVNTHSSGELLRAGFGKLRDIIASPQFMFTVMIAGLAGVMQSHNKAQDAAKALRDELERDIDYKSPRSIRQGIEEIRLEIEALEARDSGGGFLDSVIGGAQLAASVLPGVEAKMHEVNVALKELDDAEIDNLGTLAMLEEKYSVVASRLGVTAAVVEQWVHKLDVDPLTMSYDELTTALEGQVALAEGATPKQQQLADAFGQVADQTSNAEDQLSAFKDAMDALLGVELSWFDSQTKARKAMDDLVAALKEGRENGLSVKDAFNEMTEAGRNNRDSISGVVDSWMNMAESLARKGDIQGAIDLLQDVEAELRNVLGSAGLSQDAINSLLEELGLVGGTYEALISLSGADTAQASLDDLIAGLSGVGDTVAEPELRIIDATGESRATIDAWILYYAQSDPTARVYVDGRPAKPSMDALELWAQKYNSSNPTAKALLSVLDPQNKFKSLASMAASWANTSVSARADIDTSAAHNRLDALNRKIREIAGKTIYGFFGGHGARWGNVYSFAQGGFTPAHIARGEMIRYAEPETGGEAFIPRRGDAKRSLAILQEAASWYGASVTPMARGGVLSNGYGAAMSVGAPPPIRIILDPNGADRRIVEMLRQMIRVEGGGNVQTALGQGG